jgi:hypothetical protein
VPECKRRFGALALPRSLPDHIRGASAMMMVAALALPHTKSGMRRRPPRAFDPAKGCCATGELASISENDGAIRAIAVIPLTDVQLAKKLTAISAPCDAAQLSGETS